MSDHKARDDLVDRFDALALAGTEGSTKKKFGFIGGFRPPFRIGSKPGDPTTKPLPSLPTDPPPAFPVPNGVPYLQPHSSLGSLPRPPAMISIPVPQHNHEEPQSLTMQYALSPSSNARPHPVLIASAPTTPPALPRPHAPQRPTSDQLKPPLSPPPTRPGPSRPHSDSRVKPASQASPSPPPAKPTIAVSPLRRPRKRATSSPPPSPVVSSTNGDSVQCSGVTKAGKRCSRTVKLGSRLEELEEDGEEIIRYCHQHSKEIMTPSGFYSRKTGTDFIKFADWIPEYLSETTQLALRTEMERARSSADVPGYIYTFEILDSSHRLVYLKVGRAVNLVKRLDQWSKQCGSKEQVLRGYYPDAADAAQSMMRGRVTAGEKGAWCHRLERLVHLELEDLAEGMVYLDPGWPNVKAPKRVDGTPKKGRGKVYKICPDCGKQHKEIFSFARVEKGRYKGKEWDAIVKPVIEKWGAFVEAYV